MRKFLKQRLRPFAVPTFRFFFFAQSFSLIGTWSHELARSWLVLDLAGTTTALATLLLCTAIPGLFLTLHGGTIADRTDVCRLLLITKTILTISAFSLFFIVKYSHIQIWIIYIFAIIEGFVNSFDGPAFTSAFSRTLPKEDFQQGLAIQSTSFHVSRMLGPAVAGGIMAWKGPAYVFLFDALSYLGVIYMISHVQLRDKIIMTTHAVEKQIQGTFSGLKFFFSDPVSRYKLIQYFFSITIILPLMNIVFRNYLKQKFNLDAAHFGYLFAFPAMGAMAGAIYITFAALKKPIKNLLVGVPAIVFCLLILRYMNTPQSTSVLLAFGGFFAYLNIASLTQSLQLFTPDSYRGRLGAILTMGFSSIGPLMSFPIGVYTDARGFEVSIRDLTILFAVLSFGLAYANFRVRPKDVVS